MSYLIPALVALAVGPVAYRTLSARPRALALLDGLVYVAVPALVLLHLSPEVLGEGHLLPLLVMAAGVYAPLWLEHQTHRVGNRADHVALLLGISGLAVHALLEGAALVGMSRAGDVPLFTAVILHRIPVGLAVWWLLRPRFGMGVAVASVGGLMAVTSLGWGAGTELLSATQGEFFHLYEAFVGGTLVHVIFHGRPAATHLSNDRVALGFEGTGGLLGVVLVSMLAIGAASTGVDEHASSAAVEFGTRFLGLALESAPALVLAYLAAGMLSAFMPSASIRWMGRGGTLSSAARGMAVGLPIPVCSCGVVPLYETLVRKGAPPAAALAFLIATPELGLDAIFLSIPLLGARMTILRIVVAGAAALLVGWLVGRVLTTREAKLDLPETGRSADSFGARMRSALRTGLRDVVDHTAPWIILGLLVAAAATPFLEGERLAALATPWDVLLFTLVGLPMYVCASSATPLVAALMAGGLSPGAAIAFLITGPATNVTTFGIVSGLHGRKGAIRFAATLIGFAVATGIVINLAFGRIATPAFDELVTDEGTRIQWVSLVILTLLVAASLLRRGVRKSIGEIRSSLGGGHSHAHDHGSDDGHHHGSGGGHDHGSPASGAGSSCTTDGCGCDHGP